MERNRDLRKATISTVNGLPRRRPKITALNLRDSTDMDRQVELQETLRLRDREQFEKKVRDREFAKRRRVDRHGALQRSGGGGGGGESYRENESTDSSDEEYCAEEEETKIHQRNRTSQLSPTSSSLSNSRSGLRTLRSSPVVRAAGDEMLGVPVPRRARSGSAKRLQDYSNSGGVGGGDDLNRRRLSSSPAIVGLTGSGSGSPSFSGASTKKMISAEPKTRVLSNASNSKSSSVIQDEIEIEVAEALFDLMKQSQSQSQSPPKVDGESADTAAADDDLNRLKAVGGKDENNAFIVQNEQSIKVGGETTLADSVKELKKERRIDKEKFADDDDPAQELVVGGDGFVNKGKVGSPKETESPSCVTVNACDIQYPTVTKADQATIRVAAKKTTKLEIDLMAPPPLPSSSERDFLVDMSTDPKEITPGVQKKSDAISKDSPLAVATQTSEENIRVISSNRLPNLDLDKRRHDTPRVGDSTTQQQQIRQKSQYATPLLSFPFGMNSWPSVLPRPGYMPPTMQAVLPVDGSVRSSLTMQPPQFNFSQPRLKRCSTHQNIANNIQYHQQLIKKSLSSGPIGPPTLYGAKPSNLKSKSPRQKLVHGDFQGVQNFATTISDGSRIDKISDAAAAFNATANGKSIFQQANNFSHGSGLIFPNSQRQTTMTSAANSSVPASAVGSESLPSNSAGRLSVNLPLHGAPGSASFNQPTFPSMEAAPYMAMLQNNSFPNLPSFGGVHPNMPFFNSSLYSSPAFNVTQNQQQPLSLPHAPVQSASTFGGSSSHKQPKGNHQHTSTNTKISDDKFAYPSQPDKLTSRKSGGSSVSDGLVSQSVECNNNGQTYAFPVQAMNFGVMPPGNNKQHGDPSQHGSKGVMNMVPQAFALSFGSNASTTAALSFSSMMHNSAMMYQMAQQQQQQQQQQKNFQASEGANQIHGGGGQPFNFSKSDCSDSISARSTIPKSQQHQMQQQLAGGGGASAYQVKASARNPVFTSSAQTGNPNFASKWENYSQNNTALSNIPQLKSSQSSHNPVSPSANSSVSKNTNTGGSSQRSMNTVSKSTQETEVPPNGPSQKLSPACRRNVTPILGTCPNQLSELKY